MRQLFITILTLLTFSSCQSQTTTETKNFQTTFDTLNLSIDGYLRKVVLFRDNFYGMFETDRKNTTQRYKKMIVFSQNGEFIEDVFVPEEIQDMPHYDLIVENDSLYVGSAEKLSTT